MSFDGCAFDVAMRRGRIAFVRMDVGSEIGDICDRRGGLIHDYSRAA